MSLTPRLRSSQIRFVDGFLSPRGFWLFVSQIVPFASDLADAALTS
jgi:hypothetical protein